MEAEFCLEALTDALALARHRGPEIVNTDQGIQFTSSDFTRLLLEHGLAISMDGRGACLAVVFCRKCIAK